MNVSLTPEPERFARSLVESGRYRSASEVVRDSLRLLGEREAKTADLRRLVQEGVESGDPVALDSEGLRSMLLQVVQTDRPARYDVPSPAGRGTG